MAALPILIGRFLLLLGLCMPTLVLAWPHDPLPNDALKKVRIQLKWFHQFQFAGLYAALEQGYFRQLGLDVELIEGGPSINPAEVVDRGEAEFGIGNSSLLIEFNAGRSLVAVAAIFQHSPFVILARADAALRSPRDLEGRVLMGETHSDELLAYLKKAGVNLERVQIVPHRGSVRAMLPGGEGPTVDASTAYISTEPFEAGQIGLAYQIFNPRDLGIDFYGDTLFTSREFASQSPQAVMAFRDAMAAGWRYALQHQAEVIDLIQARYHPKLDRQALSFEAQSLYNLIQSDVVDIGYMSRARWESIAEVFVQTGLLPARHRLDGFIFEAESSLPHWVVLTLLWGGFLLGMGGLLVAYIVALNRRLHASLGLLQERTLALEQANTELALLSSTDALTGLANRRHFDRTLVEEIARAARTRQPLALLMADVDHFKRYNDALGHPAGDVCLQRIAAVLHANGRRAGELVARLGGEEFALLTPMDAAAAFELAERIREEVWAADIANPGTPVGRVSISFGVVSVVPPESGMAASVLVAQADHALYQAKRKGRNCSVLAGE
ncbi:diguanylate cyclase [Dechloromonas sp. ZS-1]|uniref:diguanylate cyclase n=1 Tax=Dechloromonas sp. ZS-1 TaxID=3138067 RepID=UPI0031FD14DC